MKPISHHAPHLSSTSKPSESRPGEKLSLLVQAEDPRDLAELTRDLTERDPGARITAELPLIGAVAVEVSADNVGVLADRPVKIYDNAPVRLIEPVDQGERRAEDPGEVRPLLNTAVTSLNAHILWEQGLSGQGVSVAVLDTGIAPHPDISRRIVAFFDAVNGEAAPYDDHGHGTHVAGIAAGDGENSAGAYTGVAPGANLVGIKALDGRGSGTTADIIRGIQWAVENKDTYNIRVLNMSLGGTIETSHRQDPMVQAVEAANRAGIVCVLAAGNEGPDPKTVGTPGNAPNAITVGASDDQSTIFRWDDTLADFSSRGPTRFDGLIKPDVIAPGVDITAADNASDGYVTHSGTSMATPATAGVIALLLEAHPSATPAQIKAALTSTAEPLEGQGSETLQGKGLVDAVEAELHLRDQVVATRPDPSPAG